MISNSPGLKVNLVLLVLLMIVPFSKAIANGVTYQGRILDRDGRPLTAPSVQFNLSILSLSNSQQECVLYAEQFVVDMNSGNGFFSIILGDGRGLRTDESSILFEKIFNPELSYAGGPQCPSGYSRRVGGPLLLKVSFDSGTGTQSLDPIPITAVPLALDTARVAGVSSDRVLRVEETAQALGLSANNFSLSPNNFAELVELLNGRSKKYVRASDGLDAISLPSSFGSNGQVLASNGSGGTRWATLSADILSDVPALGGRQSGQTLNGGTGSAENLTLDSTTSANKGNVLINPSGGNVGIGTTTPSASLDVNGIVRQLASNVGDAVSEKTFNVYFPSSVANQKVQVYWPANTSPLGGAGRSQGLYEVTVIGGYDHIQANGAIRKRFAIYGRASGQMVTQTTDVPFALGQTASIFTISDIAWDAENQRYYLVISNLSSAIITATIHIKSFTP